MSDRNRRIAQRSATAQDTRSGWPGKAGGTPGKWQASGEDINERIRARAYQLWQAAGSPENRSDDFWREAETQIRAGVVR